jgi:hypothetical protein
MKRNSWAAALAFVAGLCLVASVPAADPPKPDAAKKDQDTANIALAFKLADLGRQAGSPEALVGAAKLLNSVEAVTQVEGVKPVAGPESKDPPKPGKVTENPKQTATDFSKEVKGLLDEAKALAKDDKNLMAVIDAVKVNTGKGAIGGPQRMVETVDPHGAQTWTIRFAGAQQARVAVDSAGERLKLEVFYMNGNKIGEFDGRSSEIYWTPNVDKDFMVRVTNLGGKKTAYTLITN